MRFLSGPRIGLASRNPAEGGGETCGCRIHVHLAGPGTVRTGVPMSTVHKYGSHHLWGVREVTQVRRGGLLASKGWYLGPRGMKAQRSSEPFHVWTRRISPPQAAEEPDCPMWRFGR